MALLDKTRIRSTVDPVGFEYCQLCQRWFEDIVLAPAQIPDPLDPARLLELLVCDRCRKRLGE